MAHSKYGAHCAPQHNILVPNPSTLPFDIMPRSVHPGGLARQMRVGYTATVNWMFLTCAAPVASVSANNFNNDARRMINHHVRNFC